jgi:ABC-type multidrug transport system fused ATPase/permease subunit
MDEATASIDELTDHLIQKMIKTEFKETTVFTIAHRINTIIQYDRILVLENGSIKEFDTPLNLMNDKSSYFGNMIRE